MLPALQAHLRRFPERELRILIDAAQCVEEDFRALLSGSNLKQLGYTRMDMENFLSANSNLIHEIADNITDIVLSWVHPLH